MSLQASEKPTSADHFNVNLQKLFKIKKCHFPSCLLMSANMDNVYIKGEYFARTILIKVKTKGAIISLQGGGDIQLL